MAKVLEVGKVYEVLHSRKGNFRLQLTAVDDEWVDGEIVEGVARNMSLSIPNDGTGDTVMIRRAHASFKEVSDG